MKFRLDLQLPPQKMEDLMDVLPDWEKKKKK
jgi:hypothetical protein